MEKQNKQKLKKYLLDDNVHPIKYNMNLSIDIISFTFTGHVIIEIDVTKSTDKILLHAIDLNIHSIILRNNDEIIPLQISNNKMYDFIILTSKKKLTKGTYELEIYYDGIIGDNLVGLYKTKYYVDSELRYAIASQCEPTEFRRICPSFDEPDKKAIFELTISIPIHLKSFSNNYIIEEIMDEQEQKQEQNKGQKNNQKCYQTKVVKFAPSPIMSSYLFGLVIGEFDVINKLTDGISLSVCVNPGKLVHAHFALNMCEKAIKYYQDYFGIKYPLKKMDLIGVSNFGAGAMENYGIVLFRETILITTDKTLSHKKRKNAMVIFHELVHQWFGNLATLKWWDDLWLNESFANYYSLLGYDRVMMNENDNYKGNDTNNNINSNYNHNNSNYNLNFMSEYLIDAISYDSNKYSHPIHVNVINSNEINSIFDLISYSKGASVLRMIHLLIGEENMLKGIKNYLTRYSYSNATSKQLWDELNPGLNIITWINNKCYPLVKISFKNAVSIGITQTDFIAQEGQLWDIPLGIITGNNYNQKKILTKSQDVLMINIKEHKYIKLNHDKIGFYRVAYDDTLFKLLMDNYKSLSRLDQLDLLNDTFMLARLIIYPIDKYFQIINVINTIELNLFKDNSLVHLLLELSAQITYLINLLENKLALLVRIILPLYKKLLSIITWEEIVAESDDIKTLRTVIITILTKLKHDETIEKCIQLFQDDQNGVSKYSVNLQVVVNSVIMNLGKTITIKRKYNDDKYHKLLSMITSPLTTQNDKLNMVVYLSKTNNEDLLTSLLDVGFNQHFHKNDIIYLYVQAAHCNKTRMIVWNYIKKHWDKLYALLGDAKMYLVRIIADIICDFTDNGIINDILEFIKNKNITMSNKLLHSIEEIRINSDFKNSI